METLSAELAKSNRHLAIQYRPDIQGLRATAVSLVVLHHAGVPFLTGGFIGVDVFFVLSGYLITNLLTRELDSTGRINLSRFYARRVRRLLPASTLVVVVACLIQAVIASPIAQYDVLKTALATTLYSSNIYFSHIQLNYFAPRAAASDLLLHTWTLSVEEQFYLVWPVFVLLLAKGFENVRVRMLFIAALTLISLASCIWFTAFHQGVAFFQSPLRAWEFGVGGLCTFVPNHWLATNGNLCKWLATAGFITLVLSGIFIASSASFPGYVAAIPVLATISTLQAGAGAPRSLVARILSSRPSQYFGSISYSLYLWHWPVLRIAQQIFPDNSAAVRAACVVLSVLLAAITQLAVEDPIRFNSFLAPRSLLSLGILVLSMTMSIGGIAIWRVALNHSAQFQKFNEVRNDVPAFYGMGCTADSSVVRLCSFGDISHPESTVVLFGDSHAAQWFSALRDIAEHRRWKLVTIIKTACPPMNIRALSSRAAIAACEQWRNRAISIIQEMRPDMVIISSSSLYPRRDSPRLIDASDWETGSRDTFLAIAPQGIPIRFIRDTPHAEYDIPSCLAQLEWNGRATCPPLKRASALSSDIYEAQNRAAVNISNVRMIDMSDAICGRDECETEKGDVVVYRDADHLTSRYIERLEEVLETQLLASLR